MLPNKKLFIVAGLTILWSVLGLALSSQEDAFVKFDASTGGTLILLSLQAIALRLGILKVQK